MRARLSPLLAILVISSTLCAAAAFTAPLSSGSLFRSAGRVPAGLAVSPRRPPSSSRIVPLLSSKASAEPIAIASSSVSDSLYAVTISSPLAKPRGESPGSGTPCFFCVCPGPGHNQVSVMLSCRTRMIKRAEEISSSISSARSAKRLAASRTHPAQTAGRPLLSRTATLISPRIPQRSKRVQEPNQKPKPLLAPRTQTTGQGATHRCPLSRPEILVLFAEEANVATRFGSNPIVNALIASAGLQLPGRPLRQVCILPMTPLSLMALHHPATCAATALRVL